MINRPRGLASGYLGVARGTVWSTWGWLDHEIIPPVEIPPVPAVCVLVVDPLVLLVLLDSSTVIVLIPTPSAVEVSMSTDAVCVLVAYPDPVAVAVASTPAAVEVLVGPTASVEVAPDPDRSAC